MEAGNHLSRGVSGRHVSEKRRSQDVRTTDAEAPRDASLKSKRLAERLAGSTGQRHAVST